MSGVRIHGLLPNTEHEMVCVPSTRPRAAPRVGAGRRRVDAGVDIIKVKERVVRESRYPLIAASISLTTAISSSNEYDSPKMICSHVTR
jgi:hypothetical protein